MSRKGYLGLVGVIFILIALLHLLRLVMGWEAVIGGWAVPTWLSVVALILGAYLGFEAFRQSK
ncbi:hypothetical protein HY478_02565 [Candidatus Uhrbacteria bacterium]|nr:hypothetical protein [Candidatus Uhrbacteria bacterium]